MATVKKRAGSPYYQATFKAWDAAARRRITVRRSTGMQRRDAAQAQADQWEREELDPEHAARASETLGGAIVRWLELVAERVEGGQRSEGTLHCYRIKGGQLVRHLERGGDAEAPRVPLPLARLTRADVDRYIASRRRENVTANTVHKELTALRSALRLSRSLGLFARDPAEILPSDYGPQYTPRERWLPAEELRKLLDDLAARTPNHAAVVAFAVATSAELGAIERARVGDVDSTHRRARVRGTKAAARARTVPLALPWQRQLIAFALAHAESRDGKLFAPWSNITRDLATACERVGIARCGANDLRRTCCHYLASSGVSERHTAAVMGHTSSQMVRRVYGRLGADELTEHMERVAHGEAPRGAAPPDFGPRTEPANTQSDQRQHRSTRKRAPIVHACASSAPAVVC